MRDNKHAAEMLLKSGYPEDVLKRMQASFDAGGYDQVMQIAADFDIIKREQLDSKIHLIEPNQDFLDTDEPPDVAEFHAVIAGKLQPKYTAEGIEGEFESATEAIEAYKKANNIFVPNKKGHTFKSKHFIPQERAAAITPEAELAKVMAEAETIDLNHEYGFDEETTIDLNEDTDE